MKSTAGVYEPTGMDAFELCHPVSRDDFERVIVEIDGTPRQSSWRPMPVALIHEDRGRRLSAADSPWHGEHALVFRPRVIDVLGPLLRQYGELLPLLCQEAELVMYNPTQVIDALDEDQSSIWRFSDGSIMWIQRYAFRAEVIGDIDVFKIPNKRASPTFLSERFVDRWKASGLTGLEFKQVWPQ